MLGVVLLLLVSLVPGPDQFADLASAGRWDELLDVAEARLAEAPQDAEARYWLARATHVRAESLLGGDRFARDLGRQLLQRSIDLYGALGPDARDDHPDVIELRLLARYELLSGDRSENRMEGEALAGATGTLAADLEQAADDGVAAAAWLRGLLAQDMGEDGAPTWLARAAERAPERGEFALAWADALAAAGDRDQALQAWHQAAAGDVDLHELLAALLRLLPSADQARQRLDLLNGLMDDPARADDAFVGWYRAQALEALGRPEDAERAFALGTEGRTPELVRDHARLLARLDRPMEAAALLQPLLEQGHWEVLGDLVSLSVSLAQARRFDEALQVGDAVLAVEPRSEPALWNQALMLMAAGREQPCLGAFEHLISLRPGRADILNDAALAQQAFGHPEEARRLFEQAVALPGSRDAKENLAVLLLASAQPDLDRVRGLLGAILEVEPARPRALYLLQRVLLAAAR